MKDNIFRKNKTFLNLLKCLFFYVISLYISMLNWKCTMFTVEMQTVYFTRGLYSFVYSPFGARNQLSRSTDPLLTTVTYDPRSTFQESAREQ